MSFCPRQNSKPLGILVCMSEKTLQARIDETKMHIVGLKDAMERFADAAVTLTIALKNCNQLDGIDYIEELDEGKKSSHHFKYEVLANLYTLLGKLEMERGEK